MNRIIDHLPLLAGVIFAALVINGCGEETAADAYGNFEATEVTVSAEARGRIVRLFADEGRNLAAGEVVGLIDTTQLAHQRRSLVAQRQSLVSQRQATLAQQPEIAAQVAALQAQLETAEEELARTRRLYDRQAATARALNQQEGEVNVLRRRIDQAAARTGTVREQAGSIASQIEQVAARIQEIDAVIADALVVNPIQGTVLTVVAEAGETVQPGAPIYTLANLDTLTLRAYATGEQLPDLRLGMQVEVLVDGRDETLRSMAGTVVWIADQAQFTPTPIQTRENRAELVYAFDIAVPNHDGLLKVGMPGEVRFSAAGDEE